MMWVILKDVKLTYKIPKDRLPSLCIVLFLKCAGQPGPPNESLNLNRNQNLVMDTVVRKKQVLNIINVQ